MKSISSIFLIGIIMIFATSTKVLAQHENLSPSQKAGKKIYTKGIGSSDVKIMAVMSGVDVPATIMPCINCHNAKGTGNPEGGITPSNITWQSLTKNYEVTRQDGKKRPAYDERSLRKVITTGFDPAGNELHTGMPRYKMSRKDIDNLIAYIKVLGSDFDKGLSSNTITLGFHLPTKKESSRNKAVKEVVNAYVEKINSSQGIYNRKLKVKFLTNDLENNDEVFMITGFDQTRTSSYDGVPLLMSYNPQSKLTSKDENLFYLYPSLISQSTSLIDYGNTLNSYQKSAPVIVFFNSEVHKPIANQLKKRIEVKYKIASELIEINANNQGVVANDNRIKTNQVIHFVGPYQIGNKLLQSLDAKKKYPQVVLSGSISSVDINNAPKTFQDRVFFGFPTWISTRSAKGMSLYQELQKSYDISPRWRNLQFDALTMLMTIENSLKEVGLNIDRESFQSKLESLYEFSTGLMQPITFTSNKHVGSTITYIVGFDAQNQMMKLITMVNSEE